MIETGVQLSGIEAGFAIVFIAVFVLVTPVAVFRILRTILTP
jgi:hypothetical protein